MKQQNTKTYKLALMGILSAIILLQNFIPFLGYIPLNPALNLTIIQVTVIIGAVYLGPAMGGTLGLIWGLVCLFRAFVMPTSPLDPIIFVNPLVSVVPRLLIGVAAGWLFKLLARTKLPRVASYAVCGVAGSLVNTVLVLGSIYLIYRGPYAEYYNMAVSELMPAMLAVVGTNGVPEAIVSGILTPLIVLPLSRAKPIEA